jgi:hypothetical protein
MNDLSFPRSDDPERDKQIVDLVIGGKRVDDLAKMMACTVHDRDRPSVAHRLCMVACAPSSPTTVLTISALTSRRAAATTTASPSINALSAGKPRTGGACSGGGSAYSPAYTGLVDVACSANRSGSQNAGEVAERRNRRRRLPPYAEDAAPLKTIVQIGLGGAQKTNLDRRDDRDDLALYFVVVRTACRVCSRKVRIGRRGSRQNMDRKSAFVT